VAGSVGHIVNSQGQFTMALIENMGDAHEALREAFGAIWWLAGGDPEYVRLAISSYKDGLKMGSPLYEPEE
jgi:hypothetical protein